MIDTLPWYVLVSACLNSFAGLIRQPTSPLRPATLQSWRAAIIPFFPAQGHWMQIFWSVPWKKLIIWLSADTESNHNHLCERQTLKPLDLGLWWKTTTPTSLLKQKQMYGISSVIRQSFFLPKQSQRSRSVLQDGSRSLGLFRKGKIDNIAKFHRTNLVIWSHSRGTKTLSYSQINMVLLIRTLI